MFPEYWEFITPSMWLHIANDQSSKIAHVDINATQRSFSHCSHYLCFVGSKNVNAIM